VLRDYVNPRALAPLPVYGLRLIALLIAILWHSQTAKITAGLKSVM
jgi:hypothetical protein